MTRRRFGPVVFQVEGRGELGEEIVAEFDGYPVSTADAECDLRFRIVSHSDLPDVEGTRAGTGVFAPGTASIHLWNYRVVMAGGVDLHCAAELMGRWRIFGAVRHLPTALQRLADAKNNSFREFLAQGFLFSVFLPQLQLALLRQSASLLHASAIMDDDGGGVIFTGWGGSGKTSASSYQLLTAPERWTFISDDVAAVDQQGVVYHNPMGVHVYPYNTQGFEALQERLWSTMGSADRFQWKLREIVLGKAGVTRRRSPADLYGRVAENAPIKCIIFVERRPVSAPSVQPITPAELAARSANVIAYELRPLIDPILQSGAAGREDSPLPSLRGLEDSIRAVYLKAFANAGDGLWHLQVPYSAEPRMLGEFLSTTIFRR